MYITIYKHNVWSITNIMDRQEEHVNTIISQYTVYEITDYKNDILINISYNLY